MGAIAMDHDPRDPRATVFFSAVALSYRAKVNELDGEGVDNLMTMASEMLASTDPLFLAISDFATQYQMVAHDFEALRVQGERLANTIDLLGIATPRRPNRRILRG